MGTERGEREAKKKENEDCKMGYCEADEQKWCWKSLQWSHCPKCIHCVASVSALWMVSHLQKDGSWLQVAGMLWTGLVICASLIQLFYQYRRQNKLRRVSEKSEIVGKINNQPPQACLNTQQDAGHLLSIVRALLDGLVVSLLQEPVSDPRVSQIQGLLTMLETVSQLIIAAVNNSFVDEERLLQADVKEDEVVKINVEGRVKYISTYLQDRVSALRFLLQSQHQYGVCIATVQQELQEYWELLEDLHTKVTLRPEKCPGHEDPQTVLIDTEGLYTKLGLFQTRIHECHVHLSKSVQLLKELENKIQDLAQTMGLTLVSTWTNDLLQCNTHQFKKVFKDFTSLAQQTLTFVMHLQDLSVSQEKKSIKTSAEDIQSSVSSFSSFPVYRIALATENTQMDSDPQPDSKLSIINLLCGMRRQK